MALVALYMQPVRVYKEFLDFYSKLMCWATIGPVAALVNPTRVGRGFGLPSHHRRLGFMGIPRLAYPRQIWFIANYFEEEKLEWVNFMASYL
jgi:hypothetical protein